MCKQKLLMMVSALFLIALPLANAHIIDNFNRADSGTLGTATNGNTWAESGQDANDYLAIKTNRVHLHYVDYGSPIATLALALAVNITNDTITLHSLNNADGGIDTDVIKFYDDKGTLGYDFVSRGYASPADNYIDTNGVIFPWESDPPRINNITFYFDFVNGNVIVQNGTRNNFTRAMINPIKNVTSIMLGENVGVGEHNLYIDEISSNHTIAAPPADTCTISASGDHIVKDNCTWSTPQNVPANLIFRDDAPLSIVLSSVLRFTGSNQYIVIDSPTTIDIRSGGSFGGT